MNNIVLKNLFLIIAATSALKVLKSLIPMQEGSSPILLDVKTKNVGPFVPMFDNQTRDGLLAKLTSAEADRVQADTKLAGAEADRVQVDTKVASAEADRVKADAKILSVIEALVTEHGDIDECNLGTHNCSADATCSNTHGGFTCACNSGYNGDGVTCSAPTGTSLLNCFDANGISQVEVTTIAGTPLYLSRNSVRHADGDGAVALFSAPQSMTITSDGSFLYMMDSWSTNSYVRKIATTTPYTVTTIAGGPSGYEDNADGMNAKFGEHQFGIAISPDDRYLYISDGNNHKIRKIDLDNNNAVTTIAGSTQGCGSGQLNFPLGLTISDDGAALYVGNSECDTVSKVMVVDGTISDVASGFNYPAAVSFLDADTLIVGDSPANITRVMIATGIKTVIADGVYNPWALTISADKTTLFVSDGYHQLLLAYDLTTYEKKVLGGKLSIRGHVDGTGPNTRFGLSFQGIPGHDTHTVFVAEHLYGTVRKITCPY